MCQLEKGMAGQEGQMWGDTGKGRLLCPVSLRRPSSSSAPDKETCKAKPTVPLGHSAQGQALGGRVTLQRGQGWGQFQKAGSS